MTIHYNPVAATWLYNIKKPPYHTFYVNKSTKKDENQNEKVNKKLSSYSRPTQVLAAALTRWKPQCDSVFWSYLLQKNSPHLCKLLQE